MNDLNEKLLNSVIENGGDPDAFEFDDASLNDLANLFF